jgi:hypothetical protein
MEITEEYLQSRQFTCPNEGIIYTIDFTKGKQTVFFRNSYGELDACEFSIKELEKEIRNNSFILREPIYELW